MIAPQLTLLLSAPPGDLVYHLVVLFAIEAILLLALGEGRRSNWPRQTLRVTIAAIGLLILRAAQVAVALASAAGLADSTWIMPPLERFAAVMSLGLLAWAFLPWMEDFPQAGLVLVLVNSVGGIIAYALLGPEWYRGVQTTEQFYNATSANWVWSMWAIALAALASLAAIVRRRAQWGLLVAAFGLLMLGHLLHLMDAAPKSHVAGWVRLAELCAYPILAGLMLRREAEREGPPTSTLPASLAASAPWAAIEACQRVAEASNIVVAAQRAGIAVSNLLGTDVLALGLLSKNGDTIDLAAVCRASSAPRSGPTFDVASQPPVQSAINRKRAILVDSHQEAQRATLAALIGGANGPLWVQPLVHEHMAVGVLIAGRFAQRSTFAWTSSELEMLNGLCGVLAGALSTAQTGAAASQQIDQLQQQLREREAILAQAEIKVQQLGAQLAQADAQRKRAPLPTPSLPDRSATGPLPAEPRPVEEHGLPPAGEKTLQVRVKLDGASPLKSARAMMVLAHVKRVGRVVTCLPVEADLRSGGFQDEFTVTFSTSSEPSSVRAALTAIRDVINVQVQVV
jgi:GAF domain-containing protein